MTSDNAVAQAMARRTSLYTLVFTLSEKLGSIISPYMGALFPQTASDLQGALVAIRGYQNEGEDSASSQADTKKKKKKSMEVSVNAAEVEAGLMEDMLTMVEQLMCTLRIGFSKCQGQSSGKWVDKEKFDIILPLLISSMKFLNETHNPLVVEKFADLVHSQVVGTIVELAVASDGTGELWKPLNHQVLMLLRSRNPSLKIAALTVIRGCFSRIREEYLTLLPECIPFLAETLEDDNEEVEMLCKELLVELEELSGEKLDQYMQ